MWAPTELEDFLPFKPTHLLNTSFPQPPAYQMNKFLKKKDTTENIATQEYENINVKRPQERTLLRFSKLRVLKHGDFAIRVFVHSSTF